MPTPKFGRRLKELRKAAGISQETIADRLGVSQSHVSKVETGKTQPDRTRLPGLATCLGVNLWALVGGTELAGADPSGCLVTISGRPGVTHLAYFASGLTGLSEEERRRLFVEAGLVRQVCEGTRTFLYEPSHYTDPVKNPEIPAEIVYSTDRAQVCESDVVVLYCRHTSFGAGQEIEIASAAGIPIIGLLPRGLPLSRMVSGSFARMDVVEYSRPEELLTYLQPALTRAFNDSAARTHLRDSNIGRRVRELREAKTLEVETVARMAGVSPHAIRELEAQPCTRNAPSLTLIRRLAVLLDSSVGYLAEGIVVQPDAIDPLLRDSKAALDEVANDLALPFPQVTRLWNDFVGEHRQNRRLVAEARTSAMTPDDWRTRATPERPAKATQASLGLFEDDED